jgi:PPOX class probable F420-dependent enzyme
MPDSAAPPDARIEARLRADLIVWLATVRPDGRPHNVPVWFWWDGESVLIFSEPATQKVRNLRASPHVVLALDTADQGEDVVIAEGVAELVDRPSHELMPAAFGAKYAALFARLGSDPAAMAARYSQPVRVRPTRFVAW